MGSASSRHVPCLRHSLDGGHHADGKVRRRGENEGRYGPRGGEEAVRRPVNNETRQREEEASTRSFLKREVASGVEGGTEFNGHLCNILALL